MSELIERMARAIEAYEFKMPGAGGLRGKLHVSPAFARDLARVVLRAIREPGKRASRAVAGKDRGLGSCPLCHTLLADGGGIGPFCPNALCHVSDGSKLYDRLDEPQQHASRKCARLNTFRPKPCDCGVYPE